MTRISLLKDRHRGETCVIVCNGPSLNRMELTFLRDFPVIGMNKIFLGFKKFRFYPRYYVSVNPKVIEQSIDAIRGLNCVKFISRNGVGNRLQEDALTYLLETQKPRQRFCTDLEDGLHEGWTVTYAALQVAYYLGFDRVYIIGMDHRFNYQGNPNEARVMTGADSNHFADNYFGYGQTWDNPDIAHSEESYRIAREIYEADGRKILDATLNGACTQFEKIDYRELLQP